MTSENYEKRTKIKPDELIEPIADKVKYDLKIVNEKHDPTVWEKITSHRSQYSSLIVSVKEVLAKFLKPFSKIILRRQANFNAHLVQVLNKIVSQQTRQNINFQKKIEDYHYDISLFHSRVSELRQENILMKQRLERVLSAIKQNYDLPDEVVLKITNELENIWDNDYFVFENRFRGEECDIQKRQEIYLPIFTDSPVLDIGCGRGEFLSLLQREGITASGIDLNEDMIHICQEKGLKVEKISTFPYLNSLKDESMGGIFASHIIEHLETTSLRDFVKLCFNKLKKGGSIVFETPNPLSIIVSSVSFYLDISHVKPLHPEAIKFLLESCGFMDAKIKLLSPFPEEMQLQLLPSVDEPSGFDNQNIGLLNQNLEKLNNLLYGFQDYAVIGKKL